MENIEEDKIDVVPGLTTATLTVVEYEIKDWKLKKKVWKDPSYFELDFKLGDRVWPASEPFNEYFQLYEIKEVGSKFYPEGAYVCTTSGGSKRIFDFDAIIKHPGKQEQKERKIKKKRK